MKCWRCVSMSTAEQQRNWFINESYQVGDGIIYVAQRLIDFYSGKANDTHSHTHDPNAVIIKQFIFTRRCQLSESYCSCSSIFVSLIACTCGEPKPKSYPDALTDVRTLSVGVSSYNLFIRIVEHQAQAVEHVFNMRQHSITSCLRVYVCVWLVRSTCNWITEFVSIVTIENNVHKQTHKHMSHSMTIQFIFRLVRRYEWVLLIFPFVNLVDHLY